MKLSFKINKSPDFIFDYLTNMQKFVTVHPVITKIDTKNDGSYLVHETLKFGVIPFSFTYPVTLEIAVPEKIVVMRATVMKIVKVEMMFVMKSAEGYTVVEEYILFKTSLPVKRILKKVFSKQHRQLFKNIEMTKEPGWD